jgi:hypothetical protein
MIGLPGVTHTTVYHGLRDVLRRLPEVTLVTHEPNSIEKRSLRAVFDSDRLTPPTGPENPSLSVEWRLHDGTEYFRIDYIDPTVRFIVVGIVTMIIPILDRFTSSTRRLRWKLLTTNRRTSTARFPPKYSGTLQPASWTRSFRLLLHQKMRSKLYNNDPPDFSTLPTERGYDRIR